VSTTTCLKRVVSMRAGGTPSVDDSSMWSDDGMPWVSIGDMTRSGRVVETDRNVTDAGIADKRLPVGEPGTVLFAMYASVGALGVLGVRATWNQALLGIEPRSGLADARFVTYWLEHLRRDLGALTRSNTQDNLNAEQVGNLPFPLLPLASQRAIADYLDTETARIDALIEKKRRMVELLEERVASALQASMNAYGFVFPSSLEPNWGDVPLPDGWFVLHLNQALLQLTNGFVGPTRDILFDEGVRYVQSMHIKKGRIDFDRRPFFVAREWHEARPRVHLRPEDVLIVQTGDIGQVAVVPTDFGEASCHALQIARVRPEAVTGSYLGEYLRTPFGYHSLLKRATGALHPHLEGGIRDVPVVVPPLSVQVQMVAEVAAMRANATESVSRLDRQIDLLVERRQALITAAVTGELNIPRVAA
jgi:type I restriction enzyme S subunit